jgi:hypothetical protein
MSDTAIYVFDQEQLDALLTGTIDMFLEYRNHHGHAEVDAEPAAVREMIQGLESERELASCDPQFIVSSQIIPILLETTYSSTIPLLTN